MVKTFDLNVHSKLNSGMEFCARGYSIQCALSVCYTVIIHVLFSCLLASFVYVKRMLNEELAGLCLVTVQQGF